jgi:hypothetical protein
MPLRRRLHSARTKILKRKLHNAINPASESNACLEYQSNLCRRCRRIDLDQLFIGKEHKLGAWSPGTGYKTEVQRICSLNLGSVRFETFTSSCDLCQFFMELCPRAMNETLAVQDAGPGESLYPQSDDEEVPYFRGQLAITSYCKCL